MSPFSILLGAAVIVLGALSLGLVPIGALYLVRWIDRRPRRVEKVSEAWLREQADDGRARQ